MIPDQVDIKTEFEKDENLKEEDVRSVVEWILDQPHLPGITDFQAALFLKASLYDVESAQKRADDFFSVKNLWPEVFSGRNFEDPLLQKYMDTFVATVLPKRTADDYSIIFLKPLYSELQDFCIDYWFKIIDSVTMLDLYKNGSSTGHVVVVDLQDLPSNYVDKMNMFVFRKYFHYKYHIMPVQLKAIHYFNPPEFLNEIEELFGGTAPPDVPLNVHINVEDLDDFIPKKYLPQDYGGLQESVAALQEKQKSELLEYSSYFQWEEEQVTDESRRPISLNLRIFQ